MPTNHSLMSPALHLVHAHVPPYRRAPLSGCCSRWWWRMRRWWSRMQGRARFSGWTNTCHHHHHHHEPIVKPCAGIFFLVSCLHSGRVAPNFIWQAFFLLWLTKYFLLNVGSTVTTDRRRSQELIGGRKKAVPGSCSICNFIEALSVREKMDVELSNLQDGEVCFADRSSQPQFFSDTMLWRVKTHSKTTGFAR